MTTYTSTLTSTAHPLVDGDRQRTYGDPVVMQASIGKAWTGLLANLLKPGAEIDAGTVALMMAALKLVRESVGSGSPDNADDADGYLTIYRRITGADGPGDAGADATAATGGEAGPVAASAPAAPAAAT